MMLDEKFPLLVATIQRDYGFMNDIWVPNLTSDGQGDLEIKEWHINDGGLEEQVEINAREQREGRGVMIDKETGVVQFNRYKCGAFNGEIVRVWDNGTKWVTSFNMD